MGFPLFLGVVICVFIIVALELGSPLLRGIFLSCIIEALDVGCPLGRIKNELTSPTSA